MRGVTNLQSYELLQQQQQLYVGEGNRIGPIGSTLICDIELDPKLLYESALLFLGICVGLKTVLVFLETWHRQIHVKAIKEQIQIFDANDNGHHKGSAHNAKY